MSLELPTHINMLSLVGNISKFAASDKFRPYIGLLLNHVLRVLNICVHIATGQEPTPPSSSSSAVRLGRRSTRHKGGARTASPDRMTGNDPSATEDLDFDAFRGVTSS